MIETIRHILLKDEAVPAVLSSWRFWKRVFAGQVPEFEDFLQGCKRYGFGFPRSSAEYAEMTQALWHTDLCGLCGGFGTRTDQYGYYYCLCHLMKIRFSINKDIKNLESSIPVAKLNDFKAVGTRDQIESLNNAKSLTEFWIKNPNRWLVYSGDTGCGKTHLLSAIYHAWQPFTAYIVASDLGNSLYSSLEDKTLNPYMEALKRIPILLIDDLGIEHTTKWILAKLDDLIENRARMDHWFDRLTVIATNVSKQGIHERFSREMGISRIGSRLTDAGMVDWIEINANDYRLKNRNV